MAQEAVSGREPIPVPISVGLLARRSLLGGAVVLGVALFYILGIPAINGLIEGENPFKVGEPYVVFDAYQITPQDGWEVQSNELFVTLSKAGAGLVFTGPVPADEAPEDSIQTSIEGLKADTNNTWVIGDPTTFVTDAGDHGATVVAHTATDANQSWVITDGTVNITVLATSPDSAWSKISDEADAMVASIAVLPEGGGN